MSLTTALGSRPRTLSPTSTRRGFMLDEVRGRHDAHVGHIPQAHLAAVGRIDEQITDTAQTVARLWRTPHDHLEHLLLLEETPGFNAGYQRRCRPADITRFESIALSLGKVHLDIHLWLFDLQLRMHINGTVDRSEEH